MDRHGDLGEAWEAAPRYAFVWENLLAHLPPHKQAAERRWIKLKQWGRAFGLWEWDPAMRNVMSDAAWRRHLMIDVVVTHPPAFASLVRQYLDDGLYEYHRFVCVTSLEEFEHRLPHMPEVSMVLHGEVGRPFLFGSKGQLTRTTGDALRG
jgi:hypothetical protein